MVAGVGELGDERGVEVRDPLPDVEPVRAQRVAEQLRGVVLGEADLGPVVDPVADVEDLRSQRLDQAGDGVQQGGAGIVGGQDFLLDGWGVGGQRPMWNVSPGPIGMPSAGHTTKNSSQLA